jgi:hypothetical protein
MMPAELITFAHFSIFSLMNLLPAGCIVALLRMTSRCGHNDTEAMGGKSICVG